MINCCGYEELFTNFCKLHSNNVQTIDNFTYVNGKNAPTGD